MTTFSCPRTSKSGRGRPLAAKTLAIREAVRELTGVYDRMTVRGIFYQLETLEIVPKSIGGYRSVQAQVLKMRREGLLPWSFVADGTRWQRGRRGRYTKWGRGIEPLGRLPRGGRARCSPT